MDPSAPQTIPLADGHVDLAGRVVLRAGQEPVGLSDTEVRLLRALAARPAEVISRDALLRDVWGWRAGSTRTLDTTVARVRAKLGDAGSPRHLRTAVGVGYALHPAPRHTPAAPAPPALFGRAAELAALHAAHGTPVTLTGPGGAGKTALALTWAGPEAVVVELAGASTREEVVRAASRTLSLQTRRPSPDDVAHAVHARGSARVVVDNAEQVPAHAAELVAAFTRHAPAARVVCTSRAPLSVSGERVLRIDGLDAAAARALFRARAAGSPDPSYEDDDALDALLDALDRLPLAVELAAAWADLLPLDTLRARGLGALVAERRDLPERHRTLHGVVDASLALLPPWAADALRQLTAFALPVTLADAEAVLQLDDAPPTALAVRRLVRHSLLRAASGGRLAPFEVVRAAVGPADPGAVSRHAAWAANRGDALRAQLIGPHQATALPALRALAPELDRAAKTTGRHAVTALAALAESEVATPDELLARIDPLDDGADPTLAELRCAALRHAGHLDACAAALARALTLDLDDPRRVRLLDLQATVWRDVGELERAADGYDAALCLARAGGDPVAIGSVLGDQAWLHFAAGRPQDALDAFDEARALLAGAGHSAGEAVVLCNRASVTRDLGGDPLPLYERALELHRALDQRASVAITLGSMANVYADREDAPRARALLGEALALLDAGGQRHPAAVFRANAAWVDVLEGDLDAAEAGLAHARDALLALGDPRYAAIVTGNLGEVALRRGELDLAIARLTDAVRDTDATGGGKAHGVFTALRGVARVRVGDPQGLEDIVRGEAVLAAGGFAPERARVAAHRAEALAHLRQPAHEALDLAASLAGAHPTWAVREALAAARRAVG